MFAAAGCVRTAPRSTLCAPERVPDADASSRANDDDDDDSVVLDLVLRDVEARSATGSAPPETAVADTAGAAAAAPAASCL